MVSSYVLFSLNFVVVFRFSLIFDIHFQSSAGLMGNMSVELVSIRLTVGQDVAMSLVSLEVSVIDLLTEQESTECLDICWYRTRNRQLVRVCVGVSTHRLSWISLL